ncbi:hypothetical protein [Acinetobacter gerneri]|uniref:Tail assembly chaperone n=1 Tax=Acinetobacter gerneri DSM 14967 = CIP 107464 = MTCC 9824 TaxID=1120926 RepID=N8ZSY6_9GAMM|nr:hypothetical protein [Acinetobacter gerneri]ENV34555.1 hypothetical protein F960_01293 [Acinetobacter gerneri DSM 14967 = CIP 107464 = MTCC 9824]EPR82892.1 hypothetical protein L289_2617 [Acinetobacter gerneri DSM 14967 = CIP 107464 = MTCC 9824]
MKIEIEEQESAKIPSKLVEYKDGAKFLIAGIEKPSFKHAMELRGTQVNQEIGGWRAVTDESASEFALSYHKAVSHLILNWQGIEDKDGGLFEYSKQNAELLCTSTKHSIEIVVWVIDQAQKIQTEADSKKAEILGKSSDSTNTEAKSGTPKKPRKSTKS